MKVRTFPFPPFEDKLDYQYVKAFAQHKVGNLLKYKTPAIFAAITLIVAGLLAGLTPLALGVTLLYLLTIYMVW